MGQTYLFENKTRVTPSSVAAKLISRQKRLEHTIGSSYWTERQRRTRTFVNIRNLNQAG